MTNRGTGFRFTLCVVGAACLTVAAAVPAADWPQWRGPARDGRSADTGLLQRWGSDGPALAWKVTGLGTGYASIAVVGDRLYTMGDLDRASTLLALNAEGGKVVWSVKVGKGGAPGWGGFGGPRCTPTVDGGQVFAVDQWGEFVCVNAADGKEQWRKHYEKDFGASRPEWGFSESPLVDGDRVVVTPGGPDGAMVALNRKTGELIWRSRDFTDGVQYSSIVIARFGGVRQYVQLLMNHLVGISAKDGAVLWKAARKGETAVVPTPVIEGDLAYVTSGYNVGCSAFRITAKDGRFSAEEVYANQEMANHHGGVVQAGGKVFGYSDGRGLVCQEISSGKVLWAEKDRLRKGCVSFADGMLYFREEDKGTMILVKASSDGFAEQGRFAQPDRARQKAWPHPTIADGRLYLRDQGTLLCYDVKGK
ncbi:MAG TPA: PQQ-like beta-propeller repeat protein [Phycisphaerae bacterium]|nr:PQQ-like beta-propeller repeat protein [Phycisphaerae bacterium]HRY66861.1 PQQ-like beta-propeller repeat protein [Phycisphaerae bacterium]HSA26919.1 PQQ-like beta-propeller repeat protein [Phycisphaerae bacterium]